MRLFCTKKFLTELRLKKVDLSDPRPVDHPLDEWHAHIFFLYPRRKCAIFMHAQTKFCFVAYDRRRAQLNDIRGIFRKGLGQALFDEHYPAPVIKLFNDRLEDIHISVAQDRRTLGFINNRVQELKYMVESDPQDRRLWDEGIAGLALRRRPMATEKWGLSVELMRDVLQNCSELKGVEISPAGYEHDELERFYETLHY